MITRSIVCWGMFIVLSLATLGPADDPRVASDDQSEAKSPSTESPPEAIDFDKARGLLRKRQSGEKLTDAEEAYLSRAMEERRRLQAGRPGAPQGRDERMLTAVPTTGLKPLNEMTADDRYFDEEGGLYGKGQNEPPEAHLRAAQAMLKQIQPLNPQGAVDPSGRVVLVSISMSNATQEFSHFKQIADADAEKSSTLTIVDCAQGGQAMAEWVSPDARPWDEALRRLERAGVSPQQVQVAWIKLANKGPHGDLQTHGRKLQKDSLAVIQNAKAKFPNLKIAYLSSRIYGGYTSSALNPEPYAYESAYPVRWLIQDQMQGNADLAFAAGDATKPAKAPLLLWGPYLWADGTTPRNSDGLKWERSDLGPDGTHPSAAGRQKVASQLLTFFKSDPLASSWFVTPRAKISPR